MVGFPDSFLFGTATAGLQIEGGDTNNSWYEWCEAGRIADGSHSIVACDHWNRVDEDVELVKNLGSHTYRLGVEWSRIEPSEGEFDPDALDHYRYEIGRLREAGIVPLVTLHHFTNPLWLEHSGGFARTDIVQLFMRYVGFVVQGLSDLVSDWITINEPNVYLVLGYLYGHWPPGKKDPIAFWRCARNMIRCHLAAYEEIHRIAGPLEDGVKVGMAHHLRVFHAEHGGATERAICRVYNRYFQDLFVRATTEAVALRPFGPLAPYGRPGSHGYFVDFLGINYYTRDTIGIHLDPRTLFVKFGVPAGVPKNDLGWEIYEEGLREVCRRYGNAYDLPIWITENGTCDAEDRFRSQYVLDHLAVVAELVYEGSAVERYYHWTLMDNFEWAEGLSARFGLYEVDFATQKRTLRSSGALFREICDTRQLPGAATVPAPQYLP